MNMTAMFNETSNATLLTEDTVALVTNEQSDSALLNTFRSLLYQFLCQQLPKGLTVAQRIAKVFTFVKWSSFSEQSSLKSICCIVDTGSTSKEFSSHRSPSLGFWVRVPSNIMFHSRAVVLNRGAVKSSRCAAN